MNYVLGFDIGGTKCAVLLAHADNGIKILERGEFPTQSIPSPRLAVDKMINIAQQLLRAHKGIRPVALGVSCGSPMDAERGRILSPPHLPGWDDIPITDWLEEAFGIPAFLQNDANACALVEWTMGAGRGVQSMVFCTMGTGFGAGIIADGHLINGTVGLSGEIGHVRLKSADGSVGYGKAGSVETYCSGEGIAKIAGFYTEQCLREGHEPKWYRDGHTHDKLDAKLVAAYAKHGDPNGIEIYRQAGERLGQALAVLIDVLNPELIVIGSIFVHCEELLRPSMMKALIQEALPASVEACRIVPAQTGERLGDYASVMVAYRGIGYPIKAAEQCTMSEGASGRFERLFSRYPILESCRDDILFAYDLLKQAYSKDRKLLVCGNGGSAADAEHIVGELMKGFYLKRSVSLQDPGLSKCIQGTLPAISLTQHTALNTAFANDVNADYSFAQQVYGYGHKGDVLMGISTSGNARNVALAVKMAHERHMTTIGMTGADGGELAEQCTVCIRVPANSTADVQELHLPVYHTLCAMLEWDFFGNEDYVSADY